ncbi:TonB-dependent siderophore receptor [Azoarcus sp. TTM-91]|uniref:TonB-dependent siderophore receptor n=1 Tax=Azoarcus sp. TTM-91 TaxID=2691581 RepID=UPI00145CEB5D|nr:TonB-dependent receptor [Azoarcus sp. TTM-91]NMG37057.1 TonB-dependent siderophore receptor [Azoarcus sp. TTM-91]
MHRQTPHCRAKLRPAALALILALSAAAPATVLAQASAASSRDYDLPAAPLATTLNAISREAGLALTVDSALVGKRQAAAVRGRLSPQQALRAALAGSGLELVEGAAGVYTLRALPAPVPAPAASRETTLAPVTVSAQRAGDGSAELGYVTKTLSAVGPWEGRELQDTPYAISVVPAELIENIQAISPDQIFKMNPTTQLSWPTLQNDNPYVYLRGFQSSTSARNGLPRDVYGHGTSTEDVERVEILTGLSGFLYGAGNVGGLINYVSKRPTKERYNSVTLGYTGGENFYLHGDFGGPIDADGRFGYRINAVTQDGETGVDHYKVHKDFLSAAFDWHLTDDLLLQVDASRREFRSSRQPYWYMASGVARPSARSLDPTELWSQPWAYSDVDSNRFGANLSWKLSKRLALRAGYLNQYDVREYAAADNTVQANGTYNQSSTLIAPQEQKTKAYNAFVDFSFATGPVQHKLTAGYISTSWRRYDYVLNGATATTLNGASLDSPTHVPEPAWGVVGKGQKWERLAYRKTSMMVGDDIAFNDQWSLLAGVNRATVDNDMTWASPSATPTHYRKSATTPTLSLIYKPLDSLTTYVSYMESLEPGGAASDTYGGYAVTNAGAVLDPLVSEQVELGAKATLGGMLLTGALFQIDKSLQYYDVSDPTRPTYVQSGRQVHTGLELTATGNLTRNLTLIGGLTLMEARVRKNKQSPALEGKRPVGVSEQMAKIYAEYRIPGFEAVTVNGGISYTGKFYGDNANTDKMPAYTLLDAGVRYLTAMGGYPLTLRLNVNNLTDKRYWVNQYYLGDPRTVSLSANLKF